MFSKFFIYSYMYKCQTIIWLHVYTCTLIARDGFSFVFNFIYLYMYVSGCWGLLLLLLLLCVLYMQLLCCVHVVLRWLLPG